jgi:hypothetical protein
MSKQTLFSQAKGFSDFLGFHVRLQFVLISAIFVISPILIEINSALRSNHEFVSNATMVDYVAICGLLFYAIAMFYFIFATGCEYIVNLLAIIIPEESHTRSLTSILLCILFILLELILNGAILAAAFGRVLNVFDAQISEILELNRLLWSRACLKGTEGCP